MICVIVLYFDNLVYILELWFIIRWICYIFNYGIFEREENVVRVRKSERGY